MESLKSLWQWLLNRKGFIYFIVSILITGGLTAHYGKKQFEEWQIKVAIATSKNIILELKNCDDILQVINEKTNKIKNKSENELTLEYFDNVKNKVVSLKDTINNSKSLWELMFPAYTKSKEYTEVSRKVKQLDSKLIGIIGDIKSLNKKLELAETRNGIAALKITQNQLQDAINNYTQTLQSYNNLPISNNLPIFYPSSVVSPDSITTGTVILFDGSSFNPNQQYGDLLVDIPPLKIDKNKITGELEIQGSGLQQAPIQKQKNN